MVERYRPAETGEPDPPSPNVYFGAKDIKFLNTGCTLLNCTLGGGWPLGRVVNIVGDKSTGKTLLAEEAAANFLRDYPRGKVYYRESEAAFDLSYAQGLGLNTDKIDFGPDGSDTQWSTIEELYEDITAKLDAFDAEVDRRVKALRERNKRMSADAVEAARARIIKDMPPSLYIIDSLDAVSSVAELKRDIREGSYNLDKQKLLGALFREEIRRIRRAKMCLIIISQIRDRIGPFIRGKKYTRTGGKALDFYASIVLYLSDLGKVKETVKGIQRTVAIKVRAKCEKNKITAPFGECVFELRFGYGMDDEWACLDYLKEVKRLKDAGFKNAKGQDEMPTSLKDVDLAKLKSDTVRIWHDVEQAFKPAKGKYAA